MFVLSFARDRCKECGLCVSVCPPGIIVYEEGYNALGYHPATVLATDRCTGCAFCAKICPDTVIGVAMEVDG